MKQLYLLPSCRSAVIKTAVGKIYASLLVLIYLLPTVIHAEEQFCSNYIGFSYGDQDPRERRYNRLESTFYVHITQGVHHIQVEEGEFDPLSRYVDALKVAKARFDFLGIGQKDLVLDWEGQAIKGISATRMTSDYVHIIDIFAIKSPHSKIVTWLRFVEHMPRSAYDGGHSGAFMQAQEKFFKTLKLKNGAVFLSMDEDDLAS